MLVISRKLGESFFIGDDVEIHILSQKNDKIRVGIDAPKNIKIVRKELLETKKSNIEAAQSDDIDYGALLKAVSSKEI